MTNNINKIIIISLICLLIAFSDLVVLDLFLLIAGILIMRSILLKIILGALVIFNVIPGILILSGEIFYKSFANLSMFYITNDVINYINTSISLCLFSAVLFDNVFQRNITFKIPSLPKNRLNFYQSVGFLFSITYFLTFGFSENYGENQFDYGFDNFTFILLKIFLTTVALVTIVQHLYIKQTKKNLAFILYFILFFGIRGNRNHIIFIILPLILFLYSHYNYLKFYAYLFFSYIILILVGNFIKFYRGGKIDLFNLVSWVTDFGIITMINSYIINKIDKIGDFIYFDIFYGAIINLFPSIIFNKEGYHRGNASFRELINSKSDDHGVGFSYVADSIWAFGIIGPAFILFIILLFLRYFYINGNIFMIYLMVAFFIWTVRMDFAVFVKNIFYSLIIYKLIIFNVKNQRRLSISL